MTERSDLDPRDWEAFRAAAHRLLDAGIDRMRDAGMPDPLVRRFARQLRHWSGLPVALMDERFSSREADARHTHGRRQGTARRKHAAHQDAGAAQVILERWLDAGMPYPEPTP